jgi:hypothetical protein
LNLSTAVTIAIIDRFPFHNRVSGDPADLHEKFLGGWFRDFRGSGDGFVPIGCDAAIDASQQQGFVMDRK